MQSFPETAWQSPRSARWQQKATRRTTRSTGATASPAGSTDTHGVSDDAGTTPVPAGTRRNILDWLADCSTKTTVRLLAALFVLAPLVGLWAALEVYPAEDVRTALLYTLVLAIVAFAPLTGGIAHLLASRNISTITDFLGRIRSGRGLSELPLPEPSAKESDFVRLKRDMYCLGHVLDERERRLTGVLGELRVAQKQIHESMEYAGALQRQVSATDADLQLHARDGFVLMQPRDLVGGDGVWVAPSSWGYFVGVFDCTGHGVPGAFLTLVVHSYLKAVDVQELAARPGEVLAGLNRYMQDFFGDAHGEGPAHAYVQAPCTPSGSASVSPVGGEGLDAAFLYVDYTSEELVYAGAGVDILLHRHGGVERMPAQRVSVGYAHIDRHTVYEEQRLPLAGLEGVYVATDGYTDQCGGKRGFPMGKARLTRLVEEVSVFATGTSMAEARRVLQEAFDEWRGACFVRDDVTVVGFRP